jgi:hypothetical protein
VSRRSRPAGGALQQLGGKVAYRGYLICWSPWQVTNRDDGYWIERDGFHIGYARDLASARAIVDMLST